MYIEKSMTGARYGFSVDELEDTVILATYDSIVADEDVTPLWSRRFDWPVERHALCAWLADHRERWPEWGRIADVEGADALDAVIDAAMAATPPNEPADILLTRDADPAVLHLGVAYADSSCRKVASHRFTSGRARSRFLARRGRSDPLSQLWGLAEDRWLHGPRVLAPLLDALARPKDPLSTGS